MSFLNKLFGGGKESKITNTPAAHMWKPPSSINEDDYVRRCLEKEFKEESEKRTFRDDPAFARVLDPLNSRQFDKAIKEATPLLSKYSDFDLPYHWIGSAYREAGKLESSHSVLSQGVSKAKRKSILLTGIGETEWQMGNVEAALYAWAQALQFLSVNPIDCNAYLLISYVAQGIGSTDASRAFLVRVDRLRGGQVRLDAQMASRLTSLASEKQSEAMKKVISSLQNKYLS